MAGADQEKEKYAIKVLFHNSTTSFNKDVELQLQSATEDVKTLLNYARDFINKQREVSA
jgi:hypothetical protein